jgi:hypothetical protein
MQILEPYNNPFWEKSMWRRKKKEKEEDKITNIVDTSFWCNALGQRMHSARTKIINISDSLYYIQYC